MITTEQFSTTGHLWALERKLSILSRELETQTQCLTILSTTWEGRSADALADHVRLMDGHVMELRRITAEIAATRRRLP
jgi:hypothetical protein